MIDFDQAPCCGKNLDKLVQPTILLLLARAELHGYALIQRMHELEVFRGAPPDATGVYRALSIMQSRELIDFQWNTAPTGPAKKVYRITGEGRSCLERWIQTLREYRGSLDLLLNMAEEIPTGTDEGEHSSYSCAVGTPGKRC